MDNHAKCRPISSRSRSDLWRLISSNWPMPAKHAGLVVCLAALGDLEGILPAAGREAEGRKRYRAEARIQLAAQEARRAGEARLPDAEFDRGMAALQARARTDPNEAVTEEIDWFVFAKSL